jgi:Flp pilus assembly pilin Flp
MKVPLGRFLLDEKWATAMEWGLVAIGVLVAIITVVWLRWPI